MGGKRFWGQTPSTPPFPSKSTKLNIKKEKNLFYVTKNPRGVLVSCRVCFEGVAGSNLCRANFRINKILASSRMSRGSFRFTYSLATSSTTLASTQSSATSLTSQYPHHPPNQHATSSFLHSQQVIHTVHMASFGATTWHYFCNVCMFNKNFRFE